MKKQEKQTLKTHKSQVLDAFRALGTSETYARTETRMLLAARIEDALKAKAISKKQFADLMGRQPSVITKWLSGGHNFTVDTLTDIQRVLGIKLLVVETPPAVPIVFRLTAQFISEESSQVVYYPGGQCYSLQATQSNQEETPREHLQRQFNIA